MPIRPLSKTLQSIAEKELNEVPDEIQEKLEHLREWINKQPHLKCRLEDQWLVTFLRGCKFSLQKTKEKLELYYSFRSAIPVFFNNRDPFAPEVDEYFKRCMIVQIYTPEEEESSAPVVTIMRAKDYDVDQLPFDTAFKIGLMVLDLSLYISDRYVIAGEQVIVDLKGLTPIMLTQLTPENLKKSAYCINKAYPTRFKGIYLINTPSAFVSLFNATKSLLSEKVLRRVHMYSDENMEEVCKTVPRSMLPKEYGGDAGTLEELSAQVHKNLQAYKEWFAEDINYGTDESKRIEPLKDHGIFGAEGSFRQLNVD